MMVQGIPWTWTLVKVETDEGLCGVGEAQLPLGVRDILGHIERIIVGEDPRACRAPARREAASC